MIRRTLLQNAGIGMRAGSSRIPASMIGAPVFLARNSPQFAGVRFNSTTSEITNKLSQFAEVTETSGLTSDKLGYLDSIGLAQGYGPTAIVETLLEYTHVYTGLPWWGSIIAATLGLRLIMVPLYIKASRNAAKMSHVKPELDQVMSQLKSASSPAEQVEATAKRRKILKKHDIHMSHQAFPLLQAPLAYGFFQALRKMANYPVEGMSTQGHFWFQDLTQVDPYLGLQLISAGMMYSVFQLGGETGVNQMNPLMKKMMYALPVVTLVVTKEFSAAVVLYFAVNGAFSLLQTTFLRNKYARKIFKIPQAAKISPEAAAAQQKSLGEWWKEFNVKAQENGRSKMQKSNQKLGAMQKRRKDVSKNYIKKHQDDSKR